MSCLPSHSAPPHLTPCNGTNRNCSRKLGTWRGAYTVTCIPNQEIRWEFFPTSAKPMEGSWGSFTRCQNCRGRWTPVSKGPNLLGQLLICLSYWHKRSRNIEESNYRLIQSAVLESPHLHQAWKWTSVRWLHYLILQCASAFKFPARPQTWQNRDKPSLWCPFQITNPLNLSKTKWYILLSFGVVWHTAIVTQRLTG